MRKRFFIFFMIFYFSNTFAFSDKNGRMVLTLESSLDIAKGKNKDVLIANEDRKKSGAMVREAYSGALPQVSMNSVYTRNILRPAFFLKFEEETKKIEIGMANSYQNNITFNQPIWLGGKVGTALKIAKAYDNSSEYGFTNTWNNIRAQVEKTFYSVLLAQEAKNISEMILKNAQAHYENVNKRYAQGMSSEFDLLRAEVNVYNFKPQVIQTENNLKLSYNALKNVLGLDIEQEIEIEGVFSYEPMGESVIEEYNKKALDNRPDLKQLEYQTQMQELNIKIERANWYPNLFLTGGLQFQGMSDKFYLKKDQRAFSFSTGIQMQVSLFDGLKTHSRVLQAEADYQKLEYQKDKLLEGIKMEIKQAVLKMKESEQRVESQAKNVIQAEKAMKIAEVRYNSGIGTQLELFDSQIACENAQMGYVQGIYDYLIARADWKKAVGY